MAHSQQNQVAVNQSAMTSCISNKNHYPSQSGNYPHTQNDHQNNQQAQFSQSFGDTHDQNFPLAQSKNYTQVHQRQNIGNVAKISCWLSLLFCILLPTIGDISRQ